VIDVGFDAVSAFFADPPRILEPDMLARLLLQGVLFTASAFFSGSETALFSLSRYELQRLARARDPMAGALEQLLEQPRRLIVSILCGNELVNIAAAANMTAILVEFLGVEAAAVTATFVMIPLILLFGEVTPKSLAVSNPVWASTRIVAKPLSLWVRVVAPLAYVIRHIAEWTTTLFIGPEREKENLLRVDELETLVEAAVEAGELTATERLLVHGLISAGMASVSEIMTPRRQLSVIDGAVDAYSQRETFRALRHARVPVFIGELDNIVGMLHAEDMLGEGDVDAAQAPPLHPALIVPPTKEVDEMLAFFDQEEARAALVVNEFGGIDGIVTLSDVTHFLFAGVLDTQDPEASRIMAVDGGFEIDGSTPVPVVFRVIGIDIPEQVMTTMGGVVIRALGRIPAVGDSVELDGIHLEVIAMDKLRVARIRLETDKGAPSNGGIR
jgi:CBS domain containing-hemolysin-like protein